MKKFRCVIFDMDGTLADTLDEQAETINRVFETEKLGPISREGLRKLQGESLEYQIGSFLAGKDKAKTEELSVKVRRLYTEAPLRLAAPFPRIPELLLELRRRKIKTAVLSNKPEEILNADLERLFPFFAFEAVCGVRPGFPLKPDPAPVWEVLTEADVSPRDAILIGDTEIDIQAALNADCHAVGAAWGYRDAETLKAAGAQRVVSAPMELLELV
ncbi:MAG: HAD family hydrolase [Treponema sp.]|jgi:phosphoglycolate phosphatase|nr:HAD family hydrolase [Treponema sp.]